MANGPGVAAETSSARAGLLYLVGAYGCWGIFPIYWKRLSVVPPGELLANRIFWSAVCTSVFLLVARRWREVRAVFADRAKLVALLTSTTLISVNWLLFIWAVSSGHILESSLGYYMNPLVSVCLARLVLGEKLSPAAIGAVALAATGVVVLAIGIGAVPWVSVVLALTFSLYALRRKTAKVEPVVGFAVETLSIAPVALAYLVFLGARGELRAPHITAWELSLLLATGVLTAVPLVWFAEGARRLTLSTVGIVQYITPTLQFLCAVVIYGEPFTRAHLVAFSCIWIAVAIYSGDTLRRHRAAA